MKLDFICIGAQKCGTTSLHDTLIKHPNICLPIEKECLFFEIDEFYNKGIEFFYEKYFKNNFNPEKKIGFVNPNFDLNYKSIERLRKFFPNIKIIYIVRNPAKRSYSHYKMTRSRGLENLSFHEAIQIENKRLNSKKIYKGFVTKSKGIFELNHFGYLERSKYSKTINKLFNNFEHKQVFICNYEYLIKEQEKNLSDIQRFIGVEDYLKKLSHSNKAWEPRSYILSKIIYGPKKFFLIKIISKLFSSNLKKNLRVFLKKINLKESKKDKQAVDFTAINKIYFKNDIKKIRKLLSNNKLWN